MRLSLHFIGFVILLSSQFAWAQPAPPGSPAVVITEIMYHAPSAGEDNLEFIELRNPSDTNERSLSGLFFTQGIEFAFPSGILLQGHEFVIIAKDSVAFEAFFGVPAFQWTNASLSDIGGTIVLRNGFNQVVDSVKYSSTSPWPEEASGNGASIVLCNDTLENAGPSNWTAAATNTGLQVNGIPIFANPNADCSGTNSVRDAEPNGLLISPNPSNGQFSLNLPSSFQNKACKLTIADLEGRMLYSDAASQLKEHRFAIDLPNGIYVLSFSDGQHTKHERLVIVR